MRQPLSPYLNQLKNRIDLSEIPFSERGSRLLFFKENQHFTIRLAERWTKVSRKLSDYRQRPSLVDQLTLDDHSGNPLPVEVTTFPDSIEVRTPIGLFEFLFQDSETICLLLPPVICGISFHARLDNCQVDRRGGILRLTGDIRRNIAYTTNAKILENTTDSGRAKLANYPFENGCFRRKPGFIIKHHPTPGIQPLDSRPHPPAPGCSQSLDQMVFFRT